MSPDSPDDLDLLAGEQLELTDLLNTVLDKGVIVHGEVTLAVADVDLIKLNLGLLLSALETVDRHPAVNRGSLANAFGPPNFDRTPPQAQGQEEGEGRRGVDRHGRSPQGERPEVAPPALPLHAAPPAIQATQHQNAETSLNEVAHGLPTRINADPNAPESSLARLVLTLIEVLRKVLEHQAVRRMDGGKLNDREIERLGLALSQLNDRMDDLKRVFGLSDQDLQIDLGPLGRLR